MKDFSSYQKRVLLVLTLINFVNWIDRQIVYPLFPMIQREFRVSYVDLGWSQEVRFTFLGVGCC